MPVLINFSMIQVVELVCGSRAELGQRPREINQRQLTSRKTF
jgi:hypothetical protein